MNPHTHTRGRKSVYVVPNKPNKHRSKLKHHVETKLSVSRKSAMLEVNDTHSSLLLFALFLGLPFMNTSPYFPSKEHIRTLVFLLFYIDFLFAFRILPNIDVKLKIHCLYIFLSSVLNKIQKATRMLIWVLRMPTKISSNEAEICHFNELNH